MSKISSGPSFSASAWDKPDQRGAARGFFRGLAPLAILLPLVAAAWAAAAWVRGLTAAWGFFAQQQVTLITLIVGLAIAVTAYAAALAVTLRRIRRWHAAGRPRELRQAAGALWALALTALLIVVPVVVAVVMPQHPAF